MGHLGVVVKIPEVALEEVVLQWVSEFGAYSMLSFQISFRSVRTM